MLSACQSIRNVFSFSAAETILGEFPKTRYTYFDQEEKKVHSTKDMKETAPFGGSRIGTEADRRRRERRVSIPSVDDITSCSA